MALPHRDRGNDLADPIALSTRIVRVVILDPQRRIHVHKFSGGFEGPLLQQEEK